MQIFVLPEAIALQDSVVLHRPSRVAGPEGTQVSVYLSAVVPANGETDAVTVIGACTVTGVLTLAVIVPLTMQPGVYEPADG